MRGCLPPADSRRDCLADFFHSAVATMISTFQNMFSAVRLREEPDFLSHSAIQKRHPSAGNIFSAGQWKRFAPRFTFSPVQNTFSQSENTVQTREKEKFAERQLPPREYPTLASDRIQTWPAEIAANATVPSPATRESSGSRCASP